jgi:FkbM family methyltransferase
VTIGSARNTAVYKGTGEPQFKIKSIVVYTEPLDRFGCALTLVDVGAAGGLQDALKLYESYLDVVFIEPQKDAAEELRGTAHNFRSLKVIESALSSSDGPHRLHITKFAQCSSLLSPDEKVLSAYSVAPCFDVVSTIEVNCSRYETLWKLGNAPKVDLIKADVQGAEYDVLIGFGSLLQECLGVEIEAHLYPIYKQQKTLSDVVSMLEQHGLYLRRIQPQMTFDGDVVEVNAFFTRRKTGDLSVPQMEKLDLIEQMWGLQVSPAGNHIANSRGS